MNTYTVNVELLVEAYDAEAARELVVKTMRAIQDIEFEEHLLAWIVNDADLEAENIDQSDDGYGDD